ncbi:glycosyltransferase [Staphylospora marina]|uniref:glycosyltransferase n=1 Tax=Staphylospora marina TaxID=2490858 RepID=UPI000F5BBB61|nr:glycosyltransferase [Staphylospora marina]
MGKRKVLIYRNHLLPYSETFVVNQAEHLKRYEPVYAGSRRVSGLTLPEDRVMVVNEGGAAGKIREIGAKLFGFPDSFTSRVARLGPSLIHAHFGPDGLQALDLAKRTGLPLLVTFHGYDVTTRDEHAASWSHRHYVRNRMRLAGEGTLFIAISRFIRNKLLEQGYPEEKVRVHYTGINLDFFRPDPAVPRGRTVLFVGRLVENKGCRYLIEAMTEVGRTNPDVELVIIGDGPLRESLQRQAEAARVRCRFLGVRPVEEVREWMKRAAVFCVPSVEIHTGASEGIGTVFMEAQALELPVVSFATGGIPEAVIHGQTGLLAPPRDVAELARHLCRLLDDPELWTAMSRRARRHVEKLFDLKKQNGLLEDIYDECIHRFNDQSH